MSSTVQVDNPDVRVTRWTLKRGEQTGPHRHEYDYVVVPLTSAWMQIRSADGSELITDLTPGTSYFREAGAEHNVRNEEDAVLDFVEVEVVRPRSRPSSEGS
jgi:quercetin dioxygenase-like cupin family protein